MPKPIDFSALTLQDALDLAILIEEEAQERYEELSKMVGGRYPGDAADAFKTMCGYEAKHASVLGARRKELFGDAPRRVSRDQFWEVEAPEYTKPRVFMSPRQALEVALESEVKAHDFFQEALGHVKDEAVRALFEELRKEELEHQGLLAKRIAELPPGPDVEDDDADEPPAL